MGISSLEALRNSFSSFFHLSSAENINFQLVRKYQHEIKDMLNLLKPVLDAIVDTAIAFDETAQTAFTGLSQSVDKLTELIESYHPLTSKIYFVLQVESFTAMVTDYGLEILAFLKCSDLSLPDELSLSYLQSCITKIQTIGDDQISVIITKVIQDQVEGSGPDADSLSKITDSLNLNSNQKLLFEAVALEKLKENVEVQADDKGEAEYIDKLIVIVAHLHETFVTRKKNQSSNLVSVPDEFCCPLSLELMRDPVIVASGQTYERTFICEWIDNGLSVCPKTRQILSHNHLIPNCTVKALISKWCEVNDVEIPDPVNSTTLNSLSPLQTRHLPHLKTNGRESPDSNRSIGSDIKASSEELSSTSAIDELSPHGYIRTTSDPNALPIDLPQENSSPLVAHERSDPPYALPQQKDLELRARSRNQSFWRRPSEGFAEKLISAPTIETRAILSRVEISVRMLVEDMKSDSVDKQREATKELRLLTKYNVDNRIIIANCGAISLLINLLHSTDKKVQEYAVTTLLNLSLNDNNKTAIAKVDAIDPLIHVLETGSPEAKENSAATLFRLSVIEDNMIKIGQSRAIELLVDLLGNGTPRGKKDAVTALFNLSKFNENKERMVDVGAVKRLVEMMDAAAGMVDLVVAVLSNLATIPKGRAAIGQQGGICVLVEVVELGSAKGKEFAAAALLLLCTKSRRLCDMVLQEGAIPPLVALSQTGTPRAKEKAQSLLSYFRNQWHGNYGRG